MADIIFNLRNGSVVDSFYDIPGVETPISRAARAWEERPVVLPGDLDEVEPTGEWN